jgi:signal peptidase I
VIFRREGIFWVKRLIGLAGDRVAIHQGVPSVNGRPLAQEVRGGLGSGRSAKLLVETNEARRYRLQMGPASARRPHRSGSARQMATVQVPEGSIYVLGDNRDDSFDSRSFGPVPIADLRFVAMQILCSNTPERIGLRLDRPPP